MPNELVAAINTDKSLEEIQALLKREEIAPSADDNAAILSAIKLNRIEIINLLLKDKDFTLDEDDFDRKQIFDAAVRTGNINIVEMLIEDKRLQPSESIDDILWYALKKGLIEISQSLVEHDICDYQDFVDTLKIKDIENLVKTDKIEAVNFIVENSGSQILEQLFKEDLLSKMEEKKDNEWHQLAMRIRGSNKKYSPKIDRIEKKEDIAELEGGIMTMEVDELKRKTQGLSLQSSVALFGAKGAESQRKILIPARKLAKNDPDKMDITSQGEDEQTSNPQGSISPRPFGGSSQE